jgi:hypothetical protein
MHRYMGHYGFRRLEKFKTLLDATKKRGEIGGNTFFLILFCNPNG